MNVSANTSNKRLTVALIVFALLLSLFAFTGCSSTTADSNQPATTEAKQMAEEDKDTLKKGEKVTITDNYSYSVPEGSEKIDKRLGDGYTNEQNHGFAEANGNCVYITSFCIPDEPECFPDLAEYLLYKGDEDAEMEYSTFGETSMGTSRAEGSDADNEKLYITSYWWPDGESTLCCIEVASYSEKSDVPDFVRGTIKGSSHTEETYDGTDYPDSYDELIDKDSIIPPGAEESMYPSYEEFMADQISDYYQRQEELYYRDNQYEPYHW